MADARRALVQLGRLMYLPTKMALRRLTMMLALGTGHQEVEGTGWAS
jgi:hypothetical protein